LIGPAITWDTPSYLADCQSLVKDILFHREGMRGSSHPEHAVRAYAVWLFSQTDVYHELTGCGPGTRRLADVDEHLEKLLPRPMLPPEKQELVVDTEPAPSPAPPPSPRPAQIPNPVEQPVSIRVQMGKALQEIKTKLSALAKPVPASSDGPF